MKQNYKVVGEVFEEDEVQGRYIKEELHKNAIVLTIEELRECFKFGMSSFEDTQTLNKSFDDFLQSKGITL